LEIADFKGRKTGLFKPVWLADLPVDQSYLLIAREHQVLEMVFFQGPGLGSMQRDTSWGWLNLLKTGLFWQKERVRIGAGRRKSRITAHFFEDFG